MDRTEADYVNPSAFASEYSLLGYVKKLTCTVMFFIFLDSLH